jgi:hypothetical protein
VANDIMDKIIADLVKGAQESEGFMRGSRTKVEIGRDRGHEVKLAGYGGMGGGTGALLGGKDERGLLDRVRGKFSAHKNAHNYGGVGGAFGPVGAAIGADPGHRMSAAGGSLLGAMGGGTLGTLLGALEGPTGMALGAPLGALAGSIYGGHRGGEPDPSLLDRAKGAALEARYTDGVKAAAEAFGVKEAFLPALLPLAGSLLGGTALRAGAGALARGAGGKALGGLASKALPAMGKGIGGAATDMIGSMAGGAVGQKLAPQQQQQPQQMMN